MWILHVKWRGGGKTLIFALGANFVPSLQPLVVSPPKIGEGQYTWSTGDGKDTSKDMSDGKTFLRSMWKVLDLCKVISTDSSPCLPTAGKEPRVSSASSTFVSASSHVCFKFLDVMFLFKFEMLCWCVTPRDAIYILAIGSEYVYTLGLRVCVLGARSSR
jgi:hypothetical protein